jgi:MYXO-CTERM domain-containing protein
MRRALVLAALAAPALALAQVPAPVGRVVEIDNFNAVAGTNYVNVAQCAGTAPLRLEWNLGGVTLGQNETYTIFASNTAPATTGTDANACAQQDDDVADGTDVFAGQVGEGVPATLAVQRSDVNGGEAVEEAGFSCETSDSRLLYVCVHRIDAGGVRQGAAWGQFMIQLSAPNPPSITAVGPAGEDRLFVSWSRDNEGLVPDHYRARATRLSESGETVGEPITSSRVTANEVTISGLENGVRYRVEVIAFSVGGNPSEPSEPREASPAPINDFWETYGLAGGREQGGCGTGGTGPLALVAVGLLALLRRRA